MLLKLSFLLVHSFAGQQITMALDPAESQLQRKFVASVAHRLSPDGGNEFAL